MRWVAAVAQGAAVRLPVTALSFMKSQPTIASAASLQKGLSTGASCLHEYGIHAKMLRPSLTKEASFTQNAYEPHDSHQRLSSLYVKPATLGSLNALFTSLFFFFFKTISSIPTNSETTVFRREESQNESFTVYEERTAKL